MNNQYRVGKPKEGMNTLVARFSFTLFDKSVEKIKMLRRQGESEDQILEHIKDAFATPMRSPARTSINWPWGSLPEMTSRPLRWHGRSRSRRERWKLN